MKPKHQLKRISGGIWPTKDGFVFVKNAKGFTIPESKSKKYEWRHMKCNDGIYTTLCKKTARRINARDNAKEVTCPRCLNILHSKNT